MPSTAAKYWRLTKDANRHDPIAAREEFTTLVKEIAMQIAAANPLYASRTAVPADVLEKERAIYRARIGRSAPLGEKLRALARQRTEEGYMAEVRRDGEGFLFIENHCPICAAATACQGFCATELDLFRAVLGPESRWSGPEHIIAGDRRCAYRIFENGVRPMTKTVGV